MSQSMALEEWATRFDQHRPRLQSIARRTLGSPWAADDAVQETWLRLQRAERAAIDNLEAWLTTVVSRVCIDQIRHRSSRPEDLIDEPEVVDEPSEGADPSDQAMLADDLGLAMQVILDQLGPLERLALVLHDIFALSYDDIAPIVERTATAARQLASRGRAKLRAVDVDAVRSRQQHAITAFLDAARAGDFGGLLQLLDPEIELRADDDAVTLATEGAEYGAPLLTGTTRGGDAVARVFAGRAELTRLVLVDGLPAAAYVSDGVVHAVYLVSIEDGRITGLDVLADPARLASLHTAF